MNVYALKHPDGRWLYHLPMPDAFGTPGFGTATVTGVYADEQLMEHLHGSWWASSQEATRLTATAQPRAMTIGYSLTDPAAESTRFPATLSLDEWRARGDREGETLWELYSPVSEAQEPLEHVYDGPIVVLEGREPPGPGEPQWVASLPQQLTGRPEYLHLFPGYIPGLVAYLLDRFGELPQVKYVFLNHQNTRGVYVSLDVPFDPPQSRWIAYTGRNGKPLKSGRHVQQTVTRRLTLPIPDRVAGDTYDEALGAWRQQVDYWLQVVDEASVAECGACGGRGHVLHGSEKYVSK